MLLDNLSKDQLKELVKIYARNLFAMDGVWFQSIEKEQGVDAAMNHDREIWRRFTETEARRIKKFLNLPDNSGLKGMKKALQLRFPALANEKIELIREEKFLIYKIIDCRVQTARKDKDMPYHPCQSAGIIEHAYFAKVIDSRIKCETLSCYPDIKDENCACSWKFILEDD
ncbi:hypothetical protein GGR21_002587 [Dysgonomonas hofstadii]|uniref:L-2-amino-thiazoline-4-carboxylic acid hydrolase n=1 Tax=Dysgonomonas hofstadii TaxID=637886 RepID=A0A840CNK2_9BACT|nr:DUF6125 family protein [Dysgonomonas hofstadii]MBB4036681.1 hypothetical protein [Dysgonomonas hofstadii]